MIQSYDLSTTEAGGAAELLNLFRTEEGGRLTPHSKEVNGVKGLEG